MQAVAGPATKKALAWVASSLTAHELATELVESTDRMSKLVKAIKTYAYMDRGGVVKADVHEGLESTLTMLGHKLKHTQIKVVRDYDRSLPQLTMYGSELNQVWTNLLDNAIGALGEHGTIKVRRSPTTAACGSTSPTTGRASPRTCARASSTRSSPPRRRAAAPAWGSTRRAGSSSSATTARCAFDTGEAAPSSTSGCRA